MTQIQTLSQPEVTELRVLLALLRLRRPHNTGSEVVAREIVLQYIKDVIPDTASWVHRVDDIGNLIVRVGEDNGITFTAHLDTVHHSEGVNNIVLVNPKGGDRWLVADDSETGKPDVLGADDAAGIFILTELIRAGKEGTYLFFIGEECGGVGSSRFVRDNPTFSANMAVAFDRRGYKDVITHQGWGRTASDEFAHALSKELNKHMPNGEYSACPNGVYTDTSEFSEIVPECTNISVGYFNEHTTSEELDLNHLLELRDAVLAIDWTSLPIKRVPAPAGYSYASSFNSWQSTGTEYVSYCDRASALLDKHFDQLPADVTKFLRELEDMYNA